MEEFFYSKDRDFDGYLSFEEFIGEESHMEKLFKKMDKNKDVKVSKLVSNKNMMLLGFNYSFFLFRSSWRAARI